MSNVVITESVVNTAGITQSVAPDSHKDNLIDQNLNPAKENWSEMCCSIFDRILKQYEKTCQHY